MRILQAKVKWYHDCDNAPMFEVLVDKMPTAIYEEVRPGFFYSNTEGLTNGLHSLGDGKGFGGSIIACKMKDGSIVKLKGPYSFAPVSVELCGGISIIDKSSSYDQGYTFLSSHMTLPGLIECAKKAKVFLAETVNHMGNSFYEPCLRRTPPKGTASVGGWKSSMRRWRHIHPTESDWVMVNPDPFPERPLRDHTVEELSWIVDDLSESRPSHVSTNIIQYAVDIGDLSRMTALITRGIPEQEWAACRLLCRLATKEVSSV